MESTDLATFDEILASQERAVTYSGRPGGLIGTLPTALQDKLLTAYDAGATSEQLAGTLRHMGHTPVTRSMVRDWLRSERERRTQRDG